MLIEIMNLQNREEKKLKLTLKNELTKVSQNVNKSGGTGHFSGKFNEIQRWRCQNSGQVGGSSTKLNLGSCFWI